MAKNAKEALMMQSNWAQVLYVQSNLLICQERQCIGPLCLHVKIHSCTWKAQNTRGKQFCVPVACSLGVPLPV